MTTHAIHFTLLATVLCSSACYTGFDAVPEQALGEGGVAQGDDGGPSDDEGPGPGDGGGDSGGAPGDGGPEPADEEEEDPFELPGTEARLLPFHVRMTNLANLVGVEKDHFIFDELYMRRVQLGDHDFSGNIAADLAWNAQKMSVWVKSLEPVCSSIQFQERYPSVGADPTPLLQQVLARDPNEDELAAFADLVSDAADPATGDLLTCYAALSSLDFVAQ